LITLVRQRQASSHGFDMPHTRKEKGLLPLPQPSASATKDNNRVIGFAQTCFLSPLSNQGAMHSQIIHSRLFSVKRTFIRALDACGGLEPATPHTYGQALQPMGCPLATSLHIPVYLMKLYAKIGIMDEANPEGGPDTHLLTGLETYHCIPYDNSYDD
jgi:hypothetical protein